MHPILSVFKKEVLDNFRDRRTMLSALLAGPLMGPLVFAAILTMALSNQLDDKDEVLDLPVINAQLAPNLVQYLRENNLSIIELDDDVDAQALIDERTYNVILKVDEAYPAQFKAGLPATVIIIADQSNQKIQKHFMRLQQILASYSQKTAALRLQARGISSLVMNPVVIDNVDVSTPEARAIMIIGVITYFLIFAVLMGGMYLAIDTTAGERERGSLESLLTVPVPRAHLIIGKLLATGAYMAISLAITLLAFHFSVSLIPLEKINMVANFSLPVALKTFLIMIPFVAFAAAFMTVISTYSKTYKEAQSYLTMSMMLPTLPIMFAVFSSIKPQLSLMSVPSLSQHLLITELIKGNSLDSVAVIVSVVSTALVALLLSLFSIHRYYRENLLI